MAAKWAGTDTLVVLEDIRLREATDDDLAEARERRDAVAKAAALDDERRQGGASWSEKQAKQTSNRAWRTGERQAATDAANLTPNGTVYPFAHVELPLGAPERRPFITHAHYEGLSGTVDVEFTTASEFFTAASGAEEGALVLEPLTIRNRLAIAGASLRGAVRSLHETLNGSCLHVIDADFAISARADTAAARRKAFRFQLVDGKPTLLPLEEYRVPVRYDSNHFERGFSDFERDVLPAPKDRGTPCWFHDLSNRIDGELVAFRELKKGERRASSLAKVLDLDPTVAVEAHLEEGMRIGWLKLSDVPEQGTKVHQRVFAPSGDPISLQTDLIDEYNRRVFVSVREDERRDDLSQGHGFACDRGSADPKWGWRHPHHPLRHGDIVWAGVDEDSGTVDSIAPSQIHRELERVHQIGDAVPSDYRRCQSKDDLCPSCRVFGMVAGSGDRHEDAVAGHVRLSTAFGPAVNAVNLSRRELPSLMSPKPTYGPFYVKPNGKTGLWSERGAEIAGRKFYWHRDTPKPRGDNQAANQHASTVHAVPKGVTFHATIRFENLDAETLGTLLLALEPQRLGDEFANAHYKLGMGKPVGLGSVRTSISSLMLIDRVKRYRDISYEGDAIDLDSDDFGQLLHEGRTAVGRRLGELAETILADLAAVLDPETTNGRNVTYPDVPGEDGYEWFTRQRTGGRPQALARPQQVLAGSGQQVR